MQENIDSKIGNKIKSFRLKLGLQAKKLAELVGISPAYLNLIENGKRKLDGDLLLKVCQELRIEISDLVDDSIINLNNSIIFFFDSSVIFFPFKKREPFEGSNFK